MLIRVSPSLNIFELLTYNYNGKEEDIKPGQRVIIPLGNRIIPGWVISKGSAYSGRVKNIYGIVKDEYLPDKPYLDFARAVSEVYFTSIGLLLDASLSPKRKPLSNIYFFPGENEGQGEKEKAEKLSKYLKEPHKLAQYEPIEFFYKNIPPLNPEITSFTNRPPSVTEPGESQTCEKKLLLTTNRLDHYRDMFAYYTKKGRSVILAVPDNLTARFLKQNLEGVDLYNSEVKLKQREDLWFEYGQNKTGIILGGVSAVLLPVKNLGAVICERAGSATYQRSYFSKYDISLLAKLRARVFNVPLIEGFSTYTSESYRDRTSILIEDKREQKPAPVEVRMLTAKDTGIPARLIELVKNYFLENKKILVILNKKESSVFLYCGKCKKIQKCPTCSGKLEILSEEEAEPSSTTSCSKCSFEKKDFAACPKCGEGLTKMEDISIASLKKSIKREVVETGIMTVSAAGLKGEVGVINRLQASKIVIATPVIINPFFKDIFDTVIYVKPETLINIDEYSAAERIFSLISEIRELIKDKGSIDVFSTFHFFYPLKLINDEADFFVRELKYREWFALPPFAFVYNIEVKAKDLRTLGKEMRRLYQKFKTGLGIKKIFLSSRKKMQGAYKGLIEAHTLPQAMRESNLLKEKNITIELIMI